MKGFPDTTALQFLAVNTQASGANSVITLTAPTDGAQHVLDWLSWSYGGDPVSGGLTITGLADSVGNSVTFQVDITRGGPGQFVFGDRGLRALVNTAVVITLLDGTAAKKMVVQYR